MGMGSQEDRSGGRCHNFPHSEIGYQAPKTRPDRLNTRHKADLRLKIVTKLATGTPVDYQGEDLLEDTTNYYYYWEHNRDQQADIQYSSTAGRVTENKKK